MYEIVHIGDLSILKKEDLCIGIVLGNTDYQEFLAWNAEQETPLEIPAGWPQ